MSFTRQMGEQCTPGQLDALREYCSLLRVWGSRRNIMSRKDLPHLVDLHVCDSLSALPLISPGFVGSAMDLGSGAGLPGIPLAIMRPSIDFVLVDARLGRIEFLEVAVERLGLARVRSVRAGARELGAPHRGRYGVVLARAVGKLPSLVPLVAPCLAPDGFFVAFKGASYPAELGLLSGSAPLRLRDVRKTELPGGHGQRYLLVLDRN